MTLTIKKIALFVALMLILSIGALALNNVVGTVSDDSEARFKTHKAPATEELAMRFKTH